MLTVESPPWGAVTTVVGSVGVNLRHSMSYAYRMITTDTLRISPPCGT
jgi:hypothetical protein